MVQKDEDDADESDGFMETDERGNPIGKVSKSKKNKRKKPCPTGGGEIPSPLQSVHWFRVVLDEAQ